MILVRDIRFHDGSSKSKKIMDNKAIETDHFLWKSALKGGRVHNPAQNDHEVYRFFEVLLGWFGISNSISLKSIWEGSDSVAYLKVILLKYIPVIDKPLLNLIPGGWNFTETI